GAPCRRRRAAAAGRGVRPKPRPPPGRTAPAPAAAARPRSRNRSPRGRGGREAAMEPALGEAPVPAHRRIREAEGGGHLVVVEAAEEAELDDVDQPLVDPPELNQRLVEGDQLGIPLD